MRKLDKPSYLSGTVFLSCISRVANKHLKARLAAASPLVINAAQNYDRVATAAQLYTLPTHTMVGQVTSSEMVAVYDSRMVPSTAPGRKIYDAIKLAPSNGICPFCGLRDVSTLDHYLAKTLFPSFVVVPVNLVPSCKDCNKVKSTHTAVGVEDQVFHPYYDDYETDCWLKAIVVEDAPPSLVFNVSPPDSWDDVKLSRAEKHLEVFELRTLYTSNAANELLNIRGFICNLHARAGSSGLQSHLREMRSSYEAIQLNSWQSAMYRALENSRWFCDEGFRLI